MQDNAPVLTIHMLDEPVPMSDIRSARYVAFDRAMDEDPGAVMRVTNRGPPDGSQPVTLRVANQNIDGVRAPDGTLYLQSDRVPETMTSAQELFEAVSEAERPHSGTGLLQALEKGRPDEVVNQIVKDPATAKKQIDALLEHAKTDAENALRRGDDVIAKKRLDAVAYFTGKSPDWHASMGIAELRTRPDVAVMEIQEALRSPQVIQGEIFETINVRLGIPDVTELDRWNLERVDDIFKMHQVERNSHMGDVIVPELRAGGRIDFHVRLTETMKGAPLEAHAPVGNGPWYVLDDASLANLDPAMVERIIIDPPMARNLGKTVQLPSWDIGLFNPRMIETPDGQQWVRIGQASARASNVYHPSQAGKCSGSPEDDDSCKQLPYMVEVKSTA